MAEAIVTSAAEDIVAYLVPRALDIIWKSCRVKHEFEALKYTVPMLQANLDVAEEQYHGNHENRDWHRDWLEKLKDASDEVQDVFEEFNIEAMRRDLRGRNEMCQEVRTFFSSSNQLAFKLKMICKVIAVRVRLEAIKADERFRKDALPKREWRNREENKIPKKYFMGRDVDKNMIMNFLLDSNVKENVSILPIVGIGGVGKTALARYVYEDSKFDLKMWVCVSFDFEEKKIVKKMLDCVKGKEPIEDTVELEPLQKNLREKIDGKKFLLVLDDVWNMGQFKWLNLETLLERGAKGSKILITTRSDSVASINGIMPHRLEGLSKSESVDLLMQMACRKEEEKQDSQLLAIATEIVEKCHGVPLVIRTVGNLLYRKKTKHEWLLFKDRELQKVSQNEDGIKLVLKLSYDHLPSPLKQCFALCSLFPKDYEIKRQTLIDLWMAEGFIQPSNTSQDLEDIAHGYFEELLWGNFFQDFKKDPYTDEETCKMHDLMHDLACLIARNEFSLARDNPEFINERTRHISYGPTFDLIGKLSISHSKASALRTFLSIGGCWEIIERATSEADLDRLIQNFKRLRILDLHCERVEKVPWSICKLKYLTYLDLSHNDIKRLPDSITGLQSLQTLNLSWCDALEELPSDIRKLVSLRNLDIDFCSKLSYLPRGLGELSSLHRLTCFILPKDKRCAKNYCGLGELKELNNIRGRLSIENLRYVTNVEIECMNANLTEKHYLESLSLSWSDSSTDNDNNDKVLLDELRPSSNLQELGIWSYKGESFSRWMMDSLISSLPHLVKVSFGYCKRCKRLPPLGQLSCLKSLRINDLPELEYIEWDQSSPSTALFPSLSELDISYCEKLKAVSLTPSNESSTSTASFVSLSELTIRGCEILEVMPLTPHLEELTLIQCNGAVLINQMILGLNKLKTLFLWHAKFPGCLPEGFQSLTSLESLTIIECHQLTSLSQSIRHLSSLEFLRIEKCKNLDISKEESSNISDFHGLHNLRFVDFWDLPKLTSFPQWLLQARNLERLKISDCESLKDIPEQIDALESLQNLYIMGCSSLTSLPEAMRRLRSLTHLKILHCRELQESCERQPGKDKIAHIPNKEF